MAERVIGKVEKYFQKPGVAAVKIESGELKVGDMIHFHGATTDFKQQVESMEVEHGKISSGKPGDLIGIKTKDRVRSGDSVAVVEGEE
jgi:putative protease